MSQHLLSATDPYPQQRLPILESEMAYIDTGTGDLVVFLHGNPTSSYLWRNIIAHLEGRYHCLAPDLIGMGNSGKAPQHSYRSVDRARYLDV